MPISDNAPELSHIPVLLRETIDQLIDTKTKAFFDGTLGLGGHAESILNQFNTIKMYYGNDLDPQHLAFAQKRLAAFDGRVSFSNQNFAELASIIPASSPRPLSILLDLGLCSNHIDDAEKGFSFAVDGPLKMSFAGDNKAEEIVNEADEQTLTKIFRDYGEIRHARSLARFVVKNRTESPIRTTYQLRDIIESGTHPREQKKTVVLAFQAIRIAANDELNVLIKALEDACSLMQSGDRLGIISYHSLEDRIVKQTFAQKSKPVTAPTAQSLHTVVKEAEFLLKTKKPILPSVSEVANNPRARSARLRVLEKK